MKRKSLLASVTLLAAYATAVHAAADEPAANKEPTAEKEPTAAPARDPVLADTRQRELDDLADLRRAMFAEIKMTDGQRDAILGHFKAHTEFIEQYTPQPPSPDEQKKRQEERRELRRQLTEALQAGNHQKAGEIGQKTRELERQDPLVKATDEFHAAVGRELNEEQRLAFMSIVRRLYRQGDPRVQRARGLRDMRRALNFLNLSDAQQEAIRARYKDAVMAFGREGHNPDKAKAITEKLKDGILEELFEDQRKAFLDRLKTISEKPEPVRPSSTLPGSRGRRPPA